MKDTLNSLNALSCKHRRPNGGPVYALHNAVIYTAQQFASHAGVASFLCGAICRAGSGQDDHPIQADIAIVGLTTGAVDVDRKLVDVTVRNFVGGNLNILHRPDVNPHGVIRAAVAKKAKKYAKLIADRQMGGAWRS